MRELRNIIERLVMMSTELGAISPEEVAQVLPSQQSVFQGGHLWRCLLGEIERLHIRRVLKADDGNQSQAAKTLGIDYKTLLTKLKQYEMAS